MQDERSAHLASGSPRRIRPFVALLAAGVIGVASLLAFDWSLFDDSGFGISAGLMAAVVAVQLTVLLAIAVLVGLYCAPRVGLASHTAQWASHGNVSGQAIKDELKPALVVGALVSVVVVGAEYLAPILLGEQRLATVSSLLSDLVPRVLFGGITEELLLRWGFMSLIAFVLWKVAGRGTARPTPGLMWGAILVAAGVFAAAHLPAVAGAYGLTLETVAFVLAGNLVGGIAFGWLFWRHSLEAAIVAHGSAHLFAIVAGVALIMVGLGPT